MQNNSDRQTRGSPQDSENTDALKRQADLCLSQGHYIDAALAYGKIIELNPNIVEVSISLAKCFYELGDLATAQSALEHVLTIDPKNQIARKNLVLLRAKSAAAVQPVKNPQNAYPAPAMHTASGEESRSAAVDLRLSDRKAGFSFCIITNGKRPQKLANEIASIRALNMPAYEILVGGDVPVELNGVTLVSLPEAAQAGRLGEMRNRLIERSQYDHLVVADDDLVFNPDFYQGLRQYGEHYDVLCVRFLNVDGTRFWDWATIGGPRGHTLLGYDEVDPFVYVTGGLCIMKAHVAARVRWGEHQGFYQFEDVDFSRRLHAAGISIQFNRHSSVVHDDARYTQVGMVMARREEPAI